MKNTLAAVLLMTLAGSAAAGSDTPPEGPPWQRSLISAHAAAIAQGKPIFLYFTKTY